MGDPARFSVSCFRTGGVRFHKGTGEGFGESLSVILKSLTKARVVIITGVRIASAEFSAVPNFGKWAAHKRAKPFYMKIVI